MDTDKSIIINKTKQHKSKNIVSNLNKLNWTVLKFQKIKLDSDQSADKHKFHVKNNTCTLQQYQ